MQGNLGNYYKGRRNTDNPETKNKSVQDQGCHICLSSLPLHYVHCIFLAEVSIFYTVYHICEKQSRNKDLKKTWLSWKGEDADMSLKTVFSIPKGKAHLGPEEEEKCTLHREKGEDRTWFPTIGGKESCVFFFFYWIDPGADRKDLGPKLWNWRKLNKIVTMLGLMLGWGYIPGAWHDSEKTLKRKLPQGESVWMFALLYGTVSSFIFALRGLNKYLADIFWAHSLLR